MQTKHVLLVDDDPVTLGVVGAALERHGYETATCMDGAQAVQKALSREFDLVVLDLGLPSPDPRRVAVFDGFNVLNWLRRMHHQTPVLILTGREDRATEEQAITAGAFAVVRKSQRLEILLQAVQLGLDYAA